MSFHICLGLILVDNAVRELCLSKIVDLAIWLSELEQKILELSLEIERLREAIRDLGGELGLE